MKTIILLSILVVVISSISLAQIENKNLNKAYPTIGWDSLKTFIERPENYPEILRRSGWSGDIYLSLLIDSTGLLSKIEPAFGYIYVAKSDSLAYDYSITALEKILSQIKWVPSYSNDIPITDKIYRSFNFILVDKDDKGYNIVAPKFYMQQSH